MAGLVGKRLARPGGEAARSGTIGGRSGGVFAPLAFALALLASADGARAEMRIGVAANLSGADSFAGDEILAGVGRAIEEINAAGGLLGEELRTVPVDDGCDAERAEAAAQFLIEQRVAVVIGHSCSGTSMKASPVYERAGIVMVSPSATNTAVTDDGGPNVFRVIGRDDLQAAVAARHIASMFPDARVAVVADDKPYGQGLAERVRGELAQLGVTPVATASIIRGGDLIGLMETLRDVQADLVYLGGDAPDAALILRLAEDMEIELVLVSGDTLGTDEFSLIAGEAGTGARFTFPPDPRLRAPAASIVEAFRAAGREPVGYTLHAHSALSAWAEAVRRAEGLGMDEIATALREGTFETALGEIGFDEKGDVVGSEAFVIHEWRDGAYSALDVSTAAEATSAPTEAAQ